MHEIKNLDAKIKNAAINAFGTALNEFGEDRLCGFALYTDESAMSLTASVNTVEHFNSAAEGNPEFRAQYLWSPPEWKIEGYQSGLFDEINKNLSDYFDDRVESDTTDDNFQQFSQMFFENCVEALESVKGKIPEKINRNFVLVFEISDYEDVEAAVTWVKRLNNSQKAEEFEKMMQSY